MNLLWSLHGAGLWFMIGLIWFVQVVHYPLFQAVGEDHFAAYEALHTTRTTWVVMPVMCFELATAVALVFYPPTGFDVRWLILMLALLIGVWASTFFLSVPAHDVLTHKFDLKTANFLVKSNWIRTVLWTLRGVVFIVLSAKGSP